MLAETWPAWVSVFSSCQSSTDFLLYSDLLPTGPQSAPLWEGIGVADGTGKAWGIFRKQRSWLRCVSKEDSFHSRWTLVCVFVFLYVGSGCVHAFSFLLQILLPRTPVFIDRDAQNERHLFLHSSNGPLEGCYWQTKSADRQTSLEQLSVPAFC